MESAREHAARAFGALTALDVNAAERRALLEAGVSSHAADTLYPAGFTSLLPHLTEHLGGVEFARLTAPISKLRERTNRLIYERSQWEAFKADEEALDQLASRLRALLAAAWESGSRFDRRPDHADGLAEGIWWAHRGMTQRAELSVDGQLAADRLMLTAAKHLGLRY